MIVLSELRGEGYGTTSACRLSYDDIGPLSMIYLVPEEHRPRRSRKRDRMTHLESVRESAQFVRQFCGDFLRGDVERFVRIWGAHRATLDRLQ